MRLFQDWQRVAVLYIVVLVCVLNFETITVYRAGLGSSTVDQVLKYTKCKYWSSTHFFKKYLSTSSTFISSTSTSTHIKICSKVRMDI